MKKNVIGLDIGGTKIEGIVFDGKKIVRHLLIVTPKNLKDFKYSICELLRFLSFGQDVAGIGIGSAGIVSPNKGSIVSSPNLKFLKNFAVVRYLSSLGYKNIKLDNDANCFARAEKVLGQGKGFKNVIGIILGTGVGSGLYINGENYRGSHYSGGEVGQLIVGNDTLEHHYQKAKAKKDFGQVARLLSVRFSDLENVLDPDLIVLGGSVALKENKRFLSKVRTLTKKYLSNKKLRPNILVSRLESAGALGAALLINR